MKVCSSKLKKVWRGKSFGKKPMNSRETSFPSGRDGGGEGFITRSEKGKNEILEKITSIGESLAGSQKQVRRGTCESSGRGKKKVRKMQYDRGRDRLRKNP